MPAAIRLSALAACSIARSPVTVTKAFIAGSTASIRSSTETVNSTADSWPLSRDSLACWIVRAQGDVSLLVGSKLVENGSYADEIAVAIRRVGQRLFSRLAIRGDIGAQARYDSRWVRRRLRSPGVDLAQHPESGQDVGELASKDLHLFGSHPDPGESGDVLDVLRGQFHLLGKGAAQSLANCRFPRIAMRSAALVSTFPCR